jgi:guanosine-3',5'-bis(diphosphate) 3'-pyrophosphohydrolase
VVISMLAVDRTGSLAQIASAIAACDANIQNLVMVLTSPDFHKMTFEIEVRDLAQLTDVLATLKRTPGLSSVHRATVDDAMQVATVGWQQEKKVDA